MRNADKMAGDSCGMMTLVKAWRGVQPRSSAALYRLGSSWRSLGPTLKITYGILKVMCAISSVGQPKMPLSPPMPKFCAMTKRRISETPVMISGLTTGT